MTYYQVPYKNITNCLQENSRNFVFGASTNNGRRAGIGTGTSVDLLFFLSGPDLQIRNPDLQIRIDKQYKQFELFQRDPSIIKQK